MGGGGLKKVKDSEKKDRSAAMVPGTEGGGSSGAAGGAGASAGGAAAQGGLAGALADALSKRKKKVSGSGECFYFLFSSLHFFCCLVCETCAFGIWT